MAFELQVGWRYLYRGPKSVRSAIGVWVCLAIAVIGLALFLRDPRELVGVSALTAGLVGAIVFLLFHYFSVFISVSVLGVVIGVAALTVVLSVATGFQRQFREKVLGVNAHVLVMKNTNDFTEYRGVEETALGIDSDVLAVQPFVFVEMLVTRGKGELSGVAIKGIDPARVRDVLDLHKHMTEGTVDVLAKHDIDGLPPIIIGRELAHKLKAELGDEVTVVSPLSHVDVTTWTSTGEPPKTRKFRVAGIFYSGFDEYDRRLMYISLKEAQDFLEQGDVVMGVELKLRNVDHAAKVARELDDALGGPPYIVQDWRQLNKNLFTALTLQKIALLIFLTLIIAVAAFNMVSALTMMVIDKTREVAILRTMGATSGGVARVFQVVGLAIGGVGTACGLGLGLALCVVVERYGYRLDPKVYLIDRLPIAVEPLEVALVGGITMVIAALATLFPAAKASGMRPVEGLRYD